MIVGVTGSYCSGKNAVTEILTRYGFKEVNVDLIGHTALEVKRKELLEVFGNEIIVNGKIDRKKLGKIVFSDEQKKKLLEKIVHPWMIRKVKRIVSNGRNYVINAALLIEMCLFVLCDFIIGVEADEEIIFKRAYKRDGLKMDEIKARLDSQIPLKEKLQYVDIVIENNGSLHDLEKKVKEIIIKLGIKV